MSDVRNQAFPVAVKYLKDELSLDWLLGASGKEAYLSVLSIFQLNSTLQQKPKNFHSISYVRMATRYTTSDGARSRKGRFNGPT